MDLVAALKLAHKKIIVGYSCHQMLLLALAKVDAICSGTWLKTRMFPLGDYKNEEEADGWQKSVWYYCPQALSEYQLATLDLAKTVKCLDQLKTPDIFDCSYSAQLFQGANPSDVEFSEQNAFRHYLCCLKKQCELTTKATYDDTNKYLHLIFETALDLTSQLRKKGIRGKYKDFNNVAEMNISALDAFDTIRGFIYKSSWTKI